jgi:YggT family protein
MLYEIVSLLLEVVVGVLSGACLLRLYMQWLRIPMSARSGNPLGAAVMSLTNWLVLPLRRAVPALGSLDTASLLSAYLLQFLEFAVLWLLAGGVGNGVAVPVLALFGLVRMAISATTGAVIIYALLSWVPGHPAMADIIERMVAPLLAPVRRHLPLLGGLDLSPLALLLILQILAIVVGHVQASALVGL